jgi:hypothetical protein
MRQALDLLATGKAATQKAAAEAVGMAPETLSRHFRSHRHRCLWRNVRAKPSRSQPGARPNASLSCSTRSPSTSSLDASKHVLAISSIRPPETGANININNSISVGYVIDIAPQQASTRTIEHEAQNDAT